MRSEDVGEPVSASIIILTKNGEKYLRSLLKGLYSQSGIDRAEVIVIDSGSSDGTLGIVTDFPSVRIHEILSVDFGHGRTRNLGAQMARGEFLIYLPQDATPLGNDWLENLLQPFADPQVSGVFGRQVPRPDASPMEEFFLLRTYGERPEIKSLPVGEAVSLVGCFFSTVSGAIRLDVWRDHPFREDIIMSEDQAWAAEIMRAGLWVAYQPDSRVLHSHHYGVADIFRRNFDSGYSIRQIFNGCTGITVSAALAALVAEARYVARRGEPAHWLAFLPYEIARHLGFLLGIHADMLPAKIRSKFSNLKYFW